MGPRVGVDLPGIEPRSVIAILTELRRLLPTRFYDILLGLWSECRLKVSVVELESRFAGGLIILNSKIPHDAVPQMFPDVSKEELPLNLGLKSKPSDQHARYSARLLSYFILFVRNVGKCLPYYMASFPRKYYCRILKQLLNEYE